MHGLVAGLGMGDMKRLSPGFLLDAIRVRTQRDAILFRLKTQRDGGEW